MKLPSVVLFLCAQLAAVAAPDFTREVRPIFEQHCFKCHGPEKQKGGLRFDVKEGAFKKGESGESAIVPKHAADSRVIKLVTSRKDDEWMPPKGDRLTSAQIELLKRWIDAGAQWPDSAATNANLARAEIKVTDEDRAIWSFKP
jgi:mono/diheme cytochrome c family protein